MLNKLRHLNRLSVLAALVFALVLSLALTSLSPATASAATAPVTHQVSGKVTAKGASNFTLLMGGNVSATFPVTADTKYFQSGKPSSFAALAVGMQISAEVRYDGGQYYIATYVSLPTPPPPATCSNPAISGLMVGKVAAKASDSFTVIWTNGAVSNIPFVVNSATKFFLNGKAASFADMKAGQYIQFIVKSCGDGKYTAATVYLASAPAK